MDLRDYKPGDKFITRSGKTVTLDAFYFYPELPPIYQVRFTLSESYFYTDTSGRESTTSKSPYDIMRPVPKTIRMPAQKSRTQLLYNKDGGHITLFPRIREICDGEGRLCSGARMEFAKHLADQNGWLLKML